MLIMIVCSKLTMATLDCTWERNFAAVFRAWIHCASSASNSEADVSSTMFKHNSVTRG